MSAKIAWWITDNFSATCNSRECYNRVPQPSMHQRPYFATANAAIATTLYYRDYICY